jgi:hypothetical protein
MSRLTASPFHKPSPYDFIHHSRPLSPPETTSDAPGLSQAAIHAANDFEYDNIEVLPSAPPSETVASRVRRTSSLSYNPSFREPQRERSAPRTPKPLLIVVPPLTFVQEHGQLGQTLSTGPHDRLSQGILMPLYPTVCPSVCY